MRRCGAAQRRRRLDGQRPRTNETAAADDEEEERIGRSLSTGSGNHFNGIEIINAKDMLMSKPWRKLFFADRRHCLIPSHTSPSFRPHRRCRCPRQDCRNIIYQKRDGGMAFFFSLAGGAAGRMDQISSDVTNMKSSAIRRVRVT